MIRIEAAQRLLARSVLEVIEDDILDMLEEKHIKTRHVKNETWLADTKLDTVKKLLKEEGWQASGNEFTQPHVSVQVELTPHGNSTQVDFEA